MSTGNDADGKNESPAVGDLTMTPSVKPLLLTYLLILLVTFAVIAQLSTSPRTLGDLNETVTNLLAVALVVVTVGVGVRTYILKQTQYTIDGENIEYRYAFLNRERLRRLPLDEIRGYELRRGRFESLLGYGTVTFFSGGDSDGLGYVRFESVPDPDQVSESFEDGKESR